MIRVNQSKLFLIVNISDRGCFVIKGDFYSHVAFFSAFKDD